MKTVIAGSRHFQDYNFLCKSIAELKFTKDIGKITEVVSGGCYGTDRLGETYARNLNLPLKVFPADWTLGRKDGPVRNIEMMNYADQLIAFWDGRSKGTEHIIKYCRKLGKTCRVIQIP